MPLRAGAVFALLAVAATMPSLAGGRAANGLSSGSPSMLAPAFVPRQRTVVLARVGDSAELTCRVLRLADRTVSWVRSSDLQILTHAGAVFTADTRVSCAEPPDAPNPDPPDPPEDPFDPLRPPGELGGPVSLHVLRIARLRLADSGRYECQVNTEPKMSLFFNLTVVESALPSVEVWALGSGAVRGLRGGAAVLACGARYQPPPPQPLALPPLRISWQHDGRDVDPQSGRGGVSLEAERWAGGASSRLTLGALGPADAGRYSCRAGAASASLTLTVGDGDMEYDDLGDVVGQMQRDGGWQTSSAPLGRSAPYSCKQAVRLLLVLIALACS